MMTQRNMSMVGLDRESFFESCFSPSIHSLECFIKVMVDETCRMWGWDGDELIEEDMQDWRTKYSSDELMKMRDDFVDQLSIFSIDWFPELFCEELEYYTEKFINIFAGFTKKLGELDWFVNVEYELENFVKIMKFMRRWSLYPQTVREWFNTTYSPLYIITEFPSDMFNKNSLMKFEDEDQAHLIKFIKKIEDMETPDACTNFYSYSYNKTHNIIVVINTCLPLIATAA